MKREKQNYEGHRKRLRERFLKSGLKGFHDYEIVEMLLTMWTSRRDCKQQAKEAIKRFKNLRGVLSASIEELQEIKGIGPVNAVGIKFALQVGRRFLKQKLMEKPVCRSSKEVFDYLYYSIRDLHKEVFRVIFLNGKNEVMKDEEPFKGTLTSSGVYPREIMKKAIRYSAAAVILAHNHPSGDPTPSKSDKQITEDFVSAGNLMQVKVLDHIIIGNNKYFSFADEGLIEENLKL